MDGGNEFLRYDQLWQRVAPTLEPYPAPDADTEENAGTNAGARHRPGPSLRPGGRPDERPGGGGGPGPGWRPEARPPWKPDGRPETVPGPDRNLCPPFRWKDTQSALADFIQEELAEQRKFQALSRTAPAWARQTLRTLAERCGAHVRRLMAAYYLTAGERYSPAVSLGPVLPGPWGQSLRERYQSRVCAGQRYDQASDRASDPCMARLFEELSREAYRSASDLRRLLERGT